MKQDEMPLPLIRRCGCLSLETGCLIMCIISTLACIANISVGAWLLTDHRRREPEDNLISMSMVMFSTLSAVGNLVALSGICLKRAGHLQLSIVFNSVFILCIFLVAVVNCVFRHGHYFDQPLNIVLVVAAMAAGAAYSIYYLMVVNSFYRMMKMSYCESSIPI